MRGFAARAATSAFRAKKKKPSRTSRKSSNKKRRGRRIKGIAFGGWAGLVKKLLTKTGSKVLGKGKKNEGRKKSSIKSRHAKRWKNKYAAYRKSLKNKSKVKRRRK